MRLEKEFRAPKGINAFKTVVVRELDGNDEVQIALWCDQARSKRAKTPPRSPLGRSYAPKGFQLSF